MQNVANQAPRSSAACRISIEESLIHFTSTPSPEAAVAVMTVAAATGDSSWEGFVDTAMAADIARNSALCMKFLGSLSKQPPLPHAPHVLDKFLSLLDAQAVAAIFDETALRRRSHPAIACFYHASFASPSGIAITRVLQVYIKYGLPVASVVKKNICDLERATSFGHRSFLKVVIPLLQELPDEVVRSALCKSLCPMESISILVDDCSIPLQKLTTPRLLAMAKPEARCYLHARHTRQFPIPETVLADGDSAFTTH
jgi:hypothetical protein